MQTSNTDWALECCNETVMISHIKQLVIHKITPLYDVIFE